jgi:hypothetical protein
MPAPTPALTLSTSSLRNPLKVRSPTNRARQRFRHSTASDLRRDHDEHGFIFVKRDAHGVYRPNPVQIQIVKDSIAYLDRYMKEP